MSKKSKNSLPLYIVTISIIVMAAAMYFSWKMLDDGYCIPQQRTLPDSELTRAAVEGVLNRENVNPNLADSYLHSNPNCCSVDRHPSQRSIFDVITGFNFTEVEVSYRKLHASRADGMPRDMPYKNYVSVSACGKFLKWNYGFSAASN